jgi:hypothetical protein
MAESPSIWDRLIDTGAGVADSAADFADGWLQLQLFEEAQAAEAENATERDRRLDGGGIRSSRDGMRQTGAKQLPVSGQTLALMAVAGVGLALVLSR